MIYVGACGYSYKDWIGPFYPEGTRDADMLEYYSQSFGFTEINSSFYHMPRIQLAESIVRRTADDFKVAVKLFQGFTHSDDGSAALAEQFRYSVKPFAESGRLLCLLAQFPYSFHNTPRNADYLKRLREWFPDTPVNIEFRGQDWMSREVMELLKNEGLGFVCVDEPQIKGLIRNVTAVTSKVAYLRLHGRNAGKWYGGEGAERYDYRYDDEELEGFVPRIREMDRHSGVTIIAFNNHPKGRAVENAKTLIRLLSK